ncbi:MAG TPA: hypothetical protein VFL66_08260 [Gaiellaceae bacterium]|nr:hypothetical protein [Gaiellaceae bacterium]
MRARSAYTAAAAALAAFGAFEAWNHETEAWPFAAGALAPALLPAAAARSSVPPFWLGIAGFFAPQGHRLQVAALGWSAHVFARRALR